MTSSALAPHREMWRRVRQNIDVTYESLLLLDDVALLEAWRDLIATDWRKDRDWYRQRYGAVMDDNEVFELGSGLGGDGIYFMQRGARWTFSDITTQSLKVVRRICGLLDLYDADFVYIDDDFATFDLLPTYDVVWANWSLNQLAFEAARAETLAILPHLKAGGRWIEVYYPLDRPADAKGWQERYSIERLRERFRPTEMEVILDIERADHKVRWADLRRVN
jgi:hypothetical protein